MAKDHSFDIVSEVDLQEVDNAVHQVQKELAQRFDFKGSTSSIEFKKEDKKVILKSENEFKLKTLVEMLRNKCVKRNVSLKALDFKPLQTGMMGGSVQQDVAIQQGIPTEKAKEIVKFIKTLKLKVQPQIQSDQVRVQAPKIDNLQETMTSLKQKNFDVDLQFINYR